MYTLEDYDLLHTSTIYMLEPFISSHKYLFENKTIYDIGSNIGVFAELVHKYTSDYKEIHLFEPCLSHIEYSRRLLSTLPNVYFNNFGLGATDSIQPLYKTHNPSGWNTFLKKDPKQPPNFYEYMLEEQCVIRTLDSYNGPPCDFMKIDVEGFECYVLEGGMNFIKSCRPVLYIEVGWGTLHPNWNTHNKFIYQRLFDEANYRPVHFHNNTQDILFYPV
ncbi:FkbM family methyltransferase [Spirosoma flavum]|uniref:FkbM family methyltransferase n=1 Tax=Spirosoma flavum TaxID=2048557 RepID=A0ABW6AQJ8_9BACT